MDKPRFAQHLDGAAKQSIDFARRWVKNNLDGEVNYLVVPNQSFDEELKEGELIFPSDSLPEGARHGPWSAEQVVEYLWRDGRVPEWIDISVVGVSETAGVLMMLRCCGRFTDHGDLLYYRDSQHPPFGIKSPNLPPEWKDGDEKFDVNW